jgi:glycine cleavage system regulatory protein/folate-dependent phosphoribosylglycinamide formyltransferase PurN
LPPDARSGEGRGQRASRSVKVCIVGSRYFGATAFDALRSDGVDIAQVVVPAADDRLAQAAEQAGVPVHVLANPKIVPGEAIPDGVDLIVAAHTHARVSDDALARARLRGVGYHPSLLPRHRGIAAIEWTILSGDPVAGGSVYHLAAGWDRGAIAAQDWCFVAKGETARELWERALAPMGLDLLRRVVRHASEHGELPARPQDERFATKAPMIRPTVSLTEEGRAARASVVVTAIGADRPGIVNVLAERAQGFGANWAGSRMANLAGQFAGIVHFDVSAANAAGLVQALRDLEASGLRVVIAQNESSAPPAGRRIVKLELAGLDRPGIVRELSRSLAERGVSIEDLHTEIVGGRSAGEHLFNVKALLVVPESVATEALRSALERLAGEMTLDIAFGDGSPGDAAGQFRDRTS